MVQRQTKVACCGSLQIASAIPTATGYLKLNAAKSLEFWSDNYSFSNHTSQ